MIVSTGGGTMDDVQRAYDVIMPINPRLCLLQCTCGYPAEFAELDLRVITTYREKFPEIVIGYSGTTTASPCRGRVYARRTDHREALHVEQGDERHRPSVLAGAGRHEEDDSRSAAGAHGARRRPQEGLRQRRRVRC